MNRTKLLIGILKDNSAPLSDRDDAAMDLGEIDGAEVLKALLEVGVNIHEDDTLLSSVGESIASIWLRNNSLDTLQFDSLAPASKLEARVLIEKKRPEWMTTRPRSS